MFSDIYVPCNYAEFRLKNVPTIFGDTSLRIYGKVAP